MISYIIPTWNRPERLKRTLTALATLGDHRACGGAEVIVVDNASNERLVMPRELASGVPLVSLVRERNEGAAARNAGAAASDPASDWLVMLDDDSYPDDTAFLEGLQHQPADVWAVSADIFLTGRGGPRGSSPREAGGLPEVFIGCGVAVRRGLFLELGGYDAGFGYYAEEYDLAARMIRAGGRVVFDEGFTVTHAKDGRGRDMHTILARLVRNNGWVMQRYAPEGARAGAVREVRQRYRRIAEKERAGRGYGTGLAELRRTLRQQARTPLTAAQWDRFTGLAAARAALQAAYAERPFRTAAIIEAGKNAWVVARALEELGVRVLPEGEDAEAQVIGTMSPGPMRDAAEWRRGVGAPRVGLRVVAPWVAASAVRRVERVAA